MTVEPRSASAPTDTTSGQTLTGLGSDNTFMTLLMTQLKSQDPMSPMDTNSFVSQLVEFNTLDQITAIREMVQSLMSGATSGA